jgi:ER membrane protein complex subunit 3
MLPYNRRALSRVQLLRANAHHIPPNSFENRKQFFQAAFEKGEYLKDPESRGLPPPNPLADPGMADQMMNMIKSNMLSFIPQTIMMGWINFFFSGFVLREYNQIPC